MKVLLLCSMGVSSELLKKHMQDEIEHRGLEVNVSVSGIAEAYRNGQSADVILLTPQVRFNLAKIKQLFPDKKVACISEEDFVSGNGKHVVEAFYK